MKIICKRASLEHLSPSQIRELYNGVTKHQNYTTDFCIKLDKPYRVMGIQQWNEPYLDLSYLIDKSEHDFGPPGMENYIYISPRWFSEHLFTISDPTIPASWFIKRNKEIKECIGPIDLLLGYDELCNKEGHFYNLFDGDPEAREIFYQRRKEQEKQEEIEKETCICRPI